MLKTRQATQAISLYDLLKYTGELDLTDKDWDIMTTVVFNEDWEKEDLLGPIPEGTEPKLDYYDKYTKLIYLNLPILNQGCDEHTMVCDCSKFIMDWYSCYARFTNEEHCDEYTERWYREMGCDLSPDVDDGFYEVFMETFFELLEGRYSEEQYKKLFSYIMYENYLRDYMAFHDEADEDYTEPESYKAWYGKNIK